MISYGPRMATAYAPTGLLSVRGEGVECVLTPAAEAVRSLGDLALNRMGAWIWERLDGATTGDALVQALMAEFDLERGRAERDYRALIARLLELGAVSPASSLGLVRRSC